MENNNQTSNRSLQNSSQMSQTSQNAPLNSPNFFLFRQQQRLSQNLINFSILFQNIKNLKKNLNVLRQLCNNNHHTQQVAFVLSHFRSDISDLYRYAVVDFNGNVGNFFLRNCFQKLMILRRHADRLQQQISPLSFTQNITTSVISIENTLRIIKRSINGTTTWRTQTLRNRRRVGFFRGSNASSLRRVALYSFPGATFLRRSAARASSQRSFNEFTSDGVIYCVFCMTDCEVGTKMVRTKCRHEFCLKCATKWFKDNPTYPLCRQIA